MTFTNKLLGTSLVALLAFGAGQAKADLVLQPNPVDLNGTGHGAVSTILVLTSHGSGTVESGLVGWTSSGDSAIADPTATQLGSLITASALAAITPGTVSGGGYTANGSTDINTGQTHTITMGSVNWAPGDGLEIIFNPNEPGNSANTITLNQLVMTIYSASGTVLWSAPWVGGPHQFQASDAGTGNSGFAFKLDDTETAELNAISGIGATDHIGLFAYATSATGGPESFFATVVACTGDRCGDPPNDPPVPEPASLALFGVGLLGLGFVTAKRRN